MLSGEFQRKLRRLNQNIRIWCGDNDHLPAGLYVVRDGECDTICGVDKQWVGEHTEFNENGGIRRSGWRRVLQILIREDLIERRHAERVFNTHLPYYASKKARAKRYAPKRTLIDKYAVRGNV